MALLPELDDFARTCNNLQIISVADPVRYLMQEVLVRRATNRPATVYGASRGSP